MQTGHGKAGGNGEQGKYCYWGDFNASIGRGGGRRGVCGKYGLGRGNAAGRDSVDLVRGDGDGAREQLHEV